MTDQIALENSKPIVMERCKNIVRAVLTKFMMIQSPEEEYAKELEPYKEQAAEWMKTVDEIPEIVDMARLLDGPKLFLKALDCDETDPLYQFKFPYTLERMGKYYSEKVVRGVSEKKYSILADFVEPEGAEYEIPYEIEGDVFLKCNKEARKETVVVPSWIRVIDSFAFSGCEDIRHVILPDTVEEIRYGAFRYSGIKDIVVPDRVTRMENEVFEECRIPYLPETGASGTARRAGKNRTQGLRGMLLAEDCLGGRQRIQDQRSPRAGAGPAGL